MSRLSYRDGDLMVSTDDGEVSDEDAMPCVLFELMVTMNKIEEALSTIAWQLEKGEIKVHRVN